MKDPVPAASDWANRTSERGRFAAREFLARWSKETGEVPAVIVTDRMLLAYEMGYLRGWGDGCRRSPLLSDEPTAPATADDASKQGQDAAVVFVAYWGRETGEVLSPVVTDRMLFAYEMGYLRGRSDAGRDMLQLLDERKGTDDADSE